MNRENTRKLVDSHPGLFRQIDLPMTQTCMCWGVDTGDGWFDIVCEMCREIDAHCRSDATVPAVEFTQIKEKFGELTVYFVGGDDRVDEIVARASSASRTVCETCGKPGRMNSSGWLKVRCDGCR